VDEPKDILIEHLRRPAREPASNRRATGSAHASSDRDRRHGDRAAFQRRTSTSLWSASGETPEEAGPEETEGGDDADARFNGKKEEGKKENIPKSNVSVRGGGE